MIDKRSRAYAISQHHALVWGVAMTAKTMWEHERLRELDAHGIEITKKIRDGVHKAWVALSGREKRDAKRKAWLVLMAFLVEKDPKEWIT